MDVIGTMMRLGFMFIWRLNIPSGYPCVIVLTTISFLVLGMQVDFCLDLLSRRLHCSAWTGFLVIDLVG